MEKRYVGTLVLAVLGVMFVQNETFGALIELKQENVGAQDQELKLKLDTFLARLADAKTPEAYEALTKDFFSFLNDPANRGARWSKTLALTKQFEGWPRAILGEKNPIANRVRQNFLVELFLSLRYRAKTLENKAAAVQFLNLDSKNETERNTILKDKQLFEKHLNMCVDQQLIHEIDKLFPRENDENSKSSQFQICINAPKSADIDRVFATLYNTKDCIRKFFSERSGAGRSNRAVFESERDILRKSLRIITQFCQLDPNFAEKLKRNKEWMRLERVSVKGISLRLKDIDGFLKKLTEDEAFRATTLNNLKKANTQESLNNLVASIQEDRAKIAQLLELVKRLEAAGQVAFNALSPDKVLNAEDRVLWKNGIDALAMLENFCPPRPAIGNNEQGFCMFHLSPNGIELCAEMMKVFLEEAFRSDEMTRVLVSLNNPYLFFPSIEDLNDARRMVERNIETIESCGAILRARSDNPSEPKEMAVFLDDEEKILRVPSKKSSQTPNPDSKEQDLKDKFQNSVDKIKKDYAGAFDLGAVSDTQNVFDFGTLYVENLQLEDALAVARLYDTNIQYLNTEMATNLIAKIKKGIEGTKKKANLDLYYTDLKILEEAKAVLLKRPAEFKYPLSAPSASVAQMNQNQIIDLMGTLFTNPLNTNNNNNNNNNHNNNNNNNNASVPSGNPANLGGVIVDTGANAGNPAVVANPILNEEEEEARAERARAENLIERAKRMHPITHILEKLGLNVFSSPTFELSDVENAIQKAVELSTSQGGVQAISQEDLGRLMDWSIYVTEEGLENPCYLSCGNDGSEERVANGICYGIRRFSELGDIIKKGMVYLDFIYQVRDNTNLSISSTNTAQLWQRIFNKMPDANLSEAQMKNEIAKSTEEDFLKRLKRSEEYADRIANICVTSPDLIQYLEKIKTFVAAQRLKVQSGAVTAPDIIAALDHLEVIILQSFPLLKERELALAVQIFSPVHQPKTLQNITISDISRRSNELINSLLTVAEIGEPKELSSVQRLLVDYVLNRPLPIQQLVQQAFQPSVQQNAPVLEQKQNDKDKDKDKDKDGKGKGNGLRSPRSSKNNDQDPDGAALN